VECTGGMARAGAKAKEWANDTGDQRPRINARRRMQRSVNNGVRRPQPAVHHGNSPASDRAGKRGWWKNRGRGLNNGVEDCKQAASGSGPA